LEEPDLPRLTDEAVALVLHALLLCNGVTAELLTKLLPLGAAAVQGILPRPAAAAVQTSAGIGAGLVTCSNGRWQVSALGYSTAREVLASHGLLSDQF